MGSHTPEIGRSPAVAVSSPTAIVGPIAANIAFVMELTLVPLLLPAIRDQFGLSVADLAWVFNSYGIAVALGVLLGGWCGDTLGTRKVFGCGVALFAAGSLLVAASDSFEALIAGRVLQGLGGGIFSPLIPLLLTRASPHRPGRMLIVWGSIAGYVAAFAPLIYATFLDGSNWRLAFILNAVIAVLAVAILIGYAMADGPARQTRAKMDYARLFRARNLWLTFIYVFCTYGSITYFLFRLPVWLSGNEVEAASVGFLLSVMWLTFSGSSTLLRNLVDKPHIRTVMLAAPLLIATALPLLFYTDNLFLLVMSAVLVGSGLACSNAPSTQLILRFAPEGMSAVSTSLDITFARLGGIVTVAVLADTQLAAAGVVVCLLCLVAALCSVTVSRQLATGQ
ncbi:MFS transporter [uncultured Roseobacter sp.]|uniref:MFS transporter n=1 Tax=uncultured Roseobacter sp. TaxID=114847 RepID=UPI00261D8658|nr:MFS transporter [uncultured Roseobacter sp.]